MRVVLPAGAFSAPVPFAVARLEPTALAPEGAVVPMAAYRFEFGVPTLNSPATLTFDVRLAGLDPQPATPSWPRSTPAGPRSPPGAKRRATGRSPYAPSERPRRRVAACASRSPRRASCASPA